MSKSNKMQGVVLGVVLGLSSLGMSVLANADTTIVQSGVKYSVVDNEAAGVCKAIVRDQPGQLRTALYHGIRGIDRTRAHTFYQCNNKNLLSFARDVNAVKVASYLTPKFDSGQLITTEEVAAR